MKFFFISLSIFILISNFSSSEVIEYTNAKYSGDVTDNTENGYGILTFDSGTVHKGEFVNGELDGYGEKKWPSGKIYKGQFKKGTCEGVGKLTEADSKDYYVGDIIKCKRHGAGKQLFGDTTYWGNWEGDTMQGLGFIKFPDFEYWGNWVNGKMNGFGILFVTQDNDIWVGQFKDSKKIDGKWLTNAEFKKWYLRFQDGVKYTQTLERNISIINDLVELADRAVEIAHIKASEKSSGQNNSCNENLALQTKYINELNYEKLLIVAREFITLCSLENPEAVKNAYLSQIDSLEGLERYKEMIPVANICIEQNKNFNICYLKKGIALYKLEKYQESKKVFEKTIAIGSYDEFSEIAVREATKWLRIIEKGGVLN